MDSCTLNLWISHFVDQRNMWMMPFCLFGMNEFLDCPHPSSGLVSIWNAWLLAAFSMGSLMITVLNVVLFTFLV